MKTIDWIALAGVAAGAWQIYQAREHLTQYPTGPGDVTPTNCLSVRQAETSGYRSLATGTGLLALGAGVLLRGQL